MSNTSDSSNTSNTSPGGGGGSGASGLRGGDTVRRVAGLAGLELMDAEVARLAEEIEGILAHFQALRYGDTEEHGDTGTAREVGGAPLREDVSGADGLLSPPGEGAPAFEGGFFTVPRLAAYEDNDGEADRGDPRDGRETTE